MSCLPSQSAPCSARLRVPLQAELKATHVPSVQGHQARLTGTMTLPGDHNGSVRARFSNPIPVRFKDRPQEVCFVNIRAFICKPASDVSHQVCSRHPLVRVVVVSPEVSSMLHFLPSLLPKPQEKTPPPHRHRAGDSSPPNNMVMWKIIISHTDGTKVVDCGNVIPLALCLSLGINDSEPVLLFSLGKCMCKFVALENELVPCSSSKQGLRPM